MAQSSNPTPAEQPAAHTITAQNWRTAPSYVRDLGDTHSLHRMIDRETKQTCYLLYRGTSSVDMDCVNTPDYYTAPENALSWRKLPTKVKEFENGTVFLRFWDLELGVFCHVNAYKQAYNWTPNDMIACSPFTPEQANPK